MYVLGVCVTCVYWVLDHMRVYVLCVLHVCVLGMYVLNVCVCCMDHGCECMCWVCVLDMCVLGVCVCVCCM